MGSQFECRVRERRLTTPWASVNQQRFLEDVVAYGEEPTRLSVVPRPEVAKLLWWTIEWASANGKAQVVEAQTLDKLFWRTAEVEVQARNSLAQECKAGNQGSHAFPP
jgi:hypothetical protein